MRALATLAATIALAGCNTTELQPSGGACFRASQCMPGLVCVMGRCTADLSGLEGGTVPSMDAGEVMIDAGEMIDAGDVDAGDVPMVDAGPPPMVDSGPPPMVDSGPPPMMDAGPPPMMDAGFDAGPPPTPDAGFDAGFDAGVDAGPPPDPDAGP